MKQMNYDDIFTKSYDHLPEETQTLVGISNRLLLVAESAKDDNLIEIEALIIWIATIVLGGDELASTILKASSPLIDAMHIIAKEVFEDTDDEI